MSGKHERPAVQSVGCCVKECRYHSAQNYCNARSISVENEDAQRKGETFCATFESKSSL
ncbi:MAG: DUF1540 domain-containing protein [Oscillospiraceae bacterium]|nr:DUF1540 domain-containing protein [Oscillospiraceae bacterium]